MTGRFDVRGEAREVIGRSILLTGPARTGTSIMARLLYSLEGMEVFYEPSFLVNSLHLMEGASDENLADLICVILFRDFFLESLAGRNINLNRHDESSIWHAKAEALIDARLGKSHRLRDLLPRLGDFRLAFKLPDMVSRLDRLRRMFPAMVFIATVRRPEAVIASWMERGWCSDDQLRRNVSDVVLQPVEGGWYIPLWVPVHRIEEFVALPEADRCLLIVEEQYEQLAGRSDCLILDYGLLVEQPHAVFSTLVERLGERFGPRTEALLRSVRETGKTREVNPDPVRLARVTNAYAACRAKSLGKAA